MRRRMFILLAVLVVALLGFVAAITFSGATKIIAPSQAAAVALPPASFARMQLIGKAAIVIDIKTGQTLFEQNADAQLPLASIAKVAMALAVSEVLAPDDMITIPYDTAPSGSAMRLAKGTRWRAQDVIDFTLVASSNDGANILAAAADTALHEKYPAAPEGEATLWRMNDLAHSLGLEHTYFLNVNGLDFSATQSGAYGSARDMAKLFAYAASSNPSLFAGTRHDGVALTTPDGKTKTSAFNTDELQGNVPGLILGKTGYTDLAGGNLGIVFDVGLAHPVVAIVLGSTRDGRFTDMQKLVDAAEAAVAAGY